MHRTQTATPTVTRSGEDIQREIVRFEQKNKYLKGVLQNREGNEVSQGTVDATLQQIFRNERTIQALNWCLGKEFLLWE